MTQGDGSDSVTKSSTTLSKTVELRIATGSGGDINVADKAYLITIGTITGGGLAQGDNLRFNFDRNDAAIFEPYSGVIGLSGIVLEY